MANCNLCLKAVTMLLALHEDMQGTVARLEAVAKNLRLAGFEMALHEEIAQIMERQDRASVRRLNEKMARFLGLTPEQIAELLDSEEKGECKWATPRRR